MTALFENVVSEIKNLLTEDYEPVASTARETAAKLKMKIFRQLLCKYNNIRVITRRKQRKGDNF